MISLYAFLYCYNNADIAPFVFKYWEGQADKVFVLDFGSNDNIKEECEKHSFVEFVDLSAYKDDRIKLKCLINNSVWKSTPTKPDWVFIGDFQSVLWTNNGLKNTIEKYDNFTIISPLSLNVISKTFPNPNSKILLHKRKGVKVYNDEVTEHWCLFKPDSITAINYLDFDSVIAPEGDIRKIMFESGKLFKFNLTDLSREYAVKEEDKIRELNPVFPRNAFKMFDIKIKQSFPIKKEWLV